MEVAQLFTLVLGIVLTVAANSVPFERLNVNDTLLLIVDHQVGLVSLVKDFEENTYVRNVFAHAAIGKLFEDIPVIMTTSEQTGSNGPLLQEITEMYPNGTIIPRPGEIDAWDNPDFRKAVQATGRKQIVLAGIITDVCTAFLALSLRAEGYSVWANVEASGTTSTLIRDVSNSRMQAAGVQLVSTISIVADLSRDWRNPKPSKGQVTAWFNQYYPAFEMPTRLFNAAQGNHTA